MVSCQEKYHQVSSTILGLDSPKLMPQEKTDVRKHHLYIHGALPAPSEGGRYTVYPGPGKSPGR